MGGGIHFFPADVYVKSVLSIDASLGNWGHVLQDPSPLFPSSLCSAAVALGV